MKFNPFFTELVYEHVIFQRDTIFYPFWILLWQSVWENLGRSLFSDCHILVLSSHTQIVRDRSQKGALLVSTQLSAPVTGPCSLTFLSSHLRRERNTLQRAHLFCPKPVTEDGKLGEWQSQKKKPPWLCQACALAANRNSLGRQSVQQIRTRFKHCICPGLFPSIVNCLPSRPCGYHLPKSLPALCDSFLSIDSPPQAFFDKSQRCNSWSPFKTSTCLCCHLCRFLSSSLIFSISPLLFGGYQLTVYILLYCSVLSI